jgi:hypothetical protein
MSKKVGNFESVFSNSHTNKKMIVDGFQRVEFEDKAMKPRIIEIKIIRRGHDKPSYLDGEFVPPDGYHYYIFYANAEETGEPDKLKELDQNLNKEFYFNGDNNCVNSRVYPGQQVKWICLYPFTIYYGGTSIITTDEHGFPRPRQIIPYLKAASEKFKYKDGEEYGQDYYYATPDAYIVYNVLSGTYKYFVSVYIPKNSIGKGGGDIILVDDPQDHVPPPPPG